MTLRCAVKNLLLSSVTSVSRHNAKMSGEAAQAGRATRILPLPRNCGEPVNIGHGSKDAISKLNGVVNGMQYGWKEEVCVACECLQADKIIAVPTDTIYGIAGLAQSTEAVDRIYQIKNRSVTNPISICVGDVKDIYRWGEVTIEDSLLQELLPGPVTVVFKRTSELNPKLNPGIPLVGIRVPDYGFVRDVSRQSGEPLALTSANLSKAPSTVSVQEFQSLWPHLAAVFDGGTLGETPKSRLGSTVVDLSCPRHYSVIRPGSAYQETVEKLQRHGLTEMSRH